MSYVTDMIAEQLSAKGQIVECKDTSIFEALQANSSEENLNSICNAIANKINNELVLVKNKLRPFMNDIINHCNNRLNEINSTTPLNDYVIKVFELPHLLNELKSKKVVVVKRDPVELTKPLSIPLPEDDEKLFEYFKHPDAGLEMYISKLRENYGREGLINLWEKYFVNISESNPNINQMGIDTLNKLDDLYLVYTAVNNFVEERPAGVKGNDADYKEAISEFYGEVCNFLSMTAEHVSVYEANNQMVVKIVGKEAFVLGSLYSKFIEEGGSPDAILGLIVSDKRGLVDFTYNKIVEAKEELTQNWANHVKAASFLELSKQVDKHKTLYQIVLRDVYNNMVPEDLKEFLINDLEVANNILLDLLDCNYKDYVLDVELVCRDIVGKCMFPNTKFQHFAEHITEYVKVNPNFTPADGATFASIDFIIEYLTDQLYLGGVDGTRIEH